MPVLPGDPPVEVHLRRSAQARRFSLRVARLDGKVTLSLPARARETEALAFLAEQEGWLRRTLARMPESKFKRLDPKAKSEARGDFVDTGEGRGRRRRDDE